MATDSTELTFVRCPSCRSLVPAVSSRCRMCGAGLDSSDDLAGEADSASDAPAEEIEAKDASGDAAEALEAAGEEDFDDPLGDYLQDSDDEDEDDEEEEDLLEEDDDEEEEVQEAAVPAPESKKPKLKVESGSKKGGLSFKKDKNQPPAKKAKPEPAAKEETHQEKVEDKGKQEAKQPEKRRASQEKPAREDRSSRRDRRKQERSTREVKETEQKSSAKQRKQQPKKEDRMEAQLAEAPSPSFTQRPEQEGRLFGWLVTFKNSQGEALELREGKFFVTGSSLKDNDLVLEDPTVSTPHALIAVSADRGLLVQDLMSERGVFLRTPEDDTYRKEEETVRLEHGDWVRFGDEEFLISLVPTPPRR